MSKLQRNSGGSANALNLASAAITAAMIVTACGTVPAGTEDTNGHGPMAQAVRPTVGVLPGGGKGMPEFNKDDIECRQVAAARAKDNSPLPIAMGLGRPEVVASARGRTVIREANPSTTESTGSVYGNAPAADAGAVTPQQRYDTGYVQCMFGKGHKVPVSEAMSS